MKLLIIGASRGIGKALMEEAAGDGFQTTVLARVPARVQAPPGVTVLPGDVRDPAAVCRAVAGQDAICSCIGVPITFQPVDLFSTAARNLVDATAASPAQQLIAVTGIGAGESKGHGGFLYDKIFNPLFLKTIYADKDREEAILQKSNNPVLIVRPAGLTKGPRTGSYKTYTDLSGVVAKRISRRDVADFILTQLKTPSHFQKAVLLSY